MSKRPHRIKPHLPGNQSAVANRKGRITLVKVRKSSDPAGDAGMQGVQERYRK